MGRRRGAETLLILTALGSLLGALGWAALAPGRLEGHYYRETLFGLTHVITLGWVSPMILGVLLRVSPMLLGVEPRGGRWGVTVAILWCLGASGTVAHMVRGEWFGVWTAAACLLAAAVLLPGWHPGILRRARGGDPVARYAALAMLHLMLAAAVGIFIALNKHLVLLPLHPGAMLGLHFHLAEVGWVTFMILGFGRKLLPSLAPARDGEPGATRLRLLGLEAGLVLVSVGLAGVPGALAAGSILLAAALVIHAGPAVGRLVRGRVEDRASFWATVALLFLVLDALLGAGLGLGLEGFLPWPRDRLLYGYGVIALLGWNTLLITSIGLKLFPLWVWRKRFQPDWGKRPVPAVMDLYSRPLQEATGFALAAGCLVTVGGILQDAPAGIAWGIRLAAIGALAFGINFALMGRWVFLPLEFRPGPRDWERFHALRAEGGGAAGGPRP